MIIERDLKEIKPKQPAAAPSSAHVQSGIPIPKAIRVKNFSPDEWETFVEEWANGLEKSYSKVRRFGGAGDYGIDVAGLCTEKGLEGAWDSYPVCQPKHEPTDFEITYKSGCLGERNAKANYYC